MKQKEQLCWDCQNTSADKCCWFRDFTPVPDWDAEPIIKFFGYKKLKTYWIKQCPNFKKEGAKA